MKYKQQERADVETPLFINFANTPSTSEGVQEFTAQHGPLDDPSESCDYFAHEVDGMRLALEGLIAMQADGPEAAAAATQLLPSFCELVNIRLRRLSPRLSPDLRVRPASDSLIDAIWLQFANAIEDGRRFAQCKQCGNFFEISGGTGRTDKTYCSELCRKAAWRERRRKAKQMRAAGATIKEIAKALDSSVDTVKTWLDPASPAKREKPPRKRGK